MALKYCPRCHSPISVEYESDICPTCGCPIYGEDRFNDRDIVSLDEIDEKKYFLRRDLTAVTADDSDELSEDTAPEDSLKAPENAAPSSKKEPREPEPDDPEPDDPDSEPEEKEEPEEEPKTDDTGKAPGKNRILSVLRRILFIVVGVNLLAAGILYFVSHKGKKPVTVNEIMETEEAPVTSEPLAFQYGDMKPIDSIEQILSDQLPALERCIDLKIIVWNNYVTGAIDKSTDPYLRPDGEFIKDLSVVFDLVEQSDQYAFDMMKIAEAVNLMDELMELYRSAPTDEESDRNTIMKYETFKDAVNTLNNERKSFDTFKNVETLALDTLHKLP